MCGLAGARIENGEMRLEPSRPRRKRREPRATIGARVQVILNVGLPSSALGRFQ